MRRTTRSRQTSVLSDRTAREQESEENDDHNETSNASTMRAKRGPKRTMPADLPPVDEEEEEAKGGATVKAEKEENLSIVELVTRVCEGAKGEQKMIKTLMANPDKLFEEVTKSLMQRVLWTTSLMASEQGRRLGTLVIFELGVKASFDLIKRRVIKDDFKAGDMKNYGQLLLSAYRTSISRDKNENEWDGLTGPRTDEIVQGFEEIADAAMRLLGLNGEKFLGILLSAIEMADRAKYDGLIYRCFEPTLWRYLKAAHDQVRYNASRILLRFFPIVERGNPNNMVTMEHQYNYMFDMLTDEVVDIRREAVLRIQKLLSNFYTLIPPLQIKKFMDHILDENSYDSIPAVRIAVLEGFTNLIVVSEAINVTENGLKGIMPRLIEDRNEKVRLTAVRVLLRLRGHRFFKYYDIVPMDSILARLECESSDGVQKEIVRLVYGSFMPRSATADERNDRVVRLIKYGRHAALSFHRLIVPLELAKLEDAVAHLKYMCIAVYKNWRKGVPEGTDMASVDGDTTTSFDTSIMSNTSIAETSAMGMPALDETSFVFRRDKMLLECSVVLWASIAKELKNPQNENERKQVDKLMSKIFKKMFVSFRQTSLLGTVMCIGTLLPSNMLEEYSIQILSILKEKSVDDEILEPYLEAGAAWRIEELMSIIKDGLYELPSVLPAISFSTRVASPMRKKPRKSKLSPVEKIRQALHYLKYSLGSEAISTKLMTECKEQLMECFEALSHVHEVVDVYLDSLDEEDDGELKSITADDILSLYESATVLAVLMKELPSTSAASLAGSSLPSLRSSRAASVVSAVSGSSSGAAAEPEPEEDDEPIDSPHSIFFFASIQWMEASLIHRIGQCSSVERNKEQLQIKLAKISLQHAETVLASCARPPRTPTGAAMDDVMSRLMALRPPASSEDEGTATTSSSHRRASLASSAGSVIDVPEMPQKSYLERLAALVQALLYSKTPVALLRTTLKLHETLMGMDGEEGDDAREGGYEVVRASLGIAKRAAEMPYDGERLRTADVDALLNYTRVAISKGPGGTSSFPYPNLVGTVRAHCQRLLAHAIDDRGIEDVTDHTYELHEFIELIFHRFVFRHERIYREFRSHVEGFTLSFNPADTEFKEAEDEEDEENQSMNESGGRKRESEKEKRERLDEERGEHYKRFVIGCMLLRLSAPEIRKAIIREKRNDKARRSIQMDIDTVSLLKRLDEWKEAMRMDDGTDTILREMIGPF